jgi:hypothetical protein
MRQTMILEDFWAKRDESDYQPDIYRYDVDGMIID